LQAARPRMGVQRHDRELSVRLLMAVAV